MKTDSESMNGLMLTLREMAEKAFTEEGEQNDDIVAGQENLFDLSQSKALKDIRELFKAFSLEGDVLHLLDRFMESNGMQLFIGQESGYEILNE